MDLIQSMAEFGGKSFKKYEKRILQLEEENVALWLQLATLLEVAEECSITNTKTEAIVILEAYKDSFNINKGV